MHSIDHDELFVRIAEALMDLRRPPGETPRRLRRQVEVTAPEMAARIERTMVAATRFFAEQPLEPAY